MLLVNHTRLCGPIGLVELLSVGGQGHVAQLVGARTISPGLCKRHLVDQSGILFNLLDFS